MFRINQRFFVGSVGLLALGFCIPVAAGPITLAQFSGSETVIDFEGLAVGTFVTTEYSAVGATFGGSGQVIVGADSQTSLIYETGTETVIFSAPVHRVGIDVKNALNPVYLDAYMGSTFLGTVSWPVGDGFIGFEAAGDFITHAVIHNSGFSFQFDNLRFENYGNAAPIPEPATVLLLGCGLLGIGVLSRRHRRKAS